MWRVRFRGWETDTRILTDASCSWRRVSPKRGSADHFEWMSIKSSACAIATGSLEVHPYSMITPGIVRVPPKSSLARLRGRHTRTASEHEIDEALWAAYRRYDKTAVTQNLLRRYLTLAKVLRRRRNFRS
jgi:hypothetical protein